ncbi:MAG: hypothetical protein M1817_005802 [Caeruleum heppii]|nr:MAG: hypothetical protein M1817_005802 [Caeruleum heppii]
MSRHRRSANVTVAIFWIFLFNAVAAISILGIQKDPKAANKGLHVWSSVVTYDRPTDETLFTDAEFTALARQAHDEMWADFENWKEVLGKQKREWRPTVMAAMSVGKKIYFSSSLRGARGMLYEFEKRGEPKSDILFALERCQLALQNTIGSDTEERHRTHGACGEIMARHQWYRDPDRQETDKVRMTAWGRSVRDSGEGFFMEPCWDVQENLYLRLGSEDDLSKPGFFYSSAPYNTTPTGSLDDYALVFLELRHTAQEDPQGWAASSELALDNSLGRLAVM